MQVLLSQIVVDPRDTLSKWLGEKEFTQSIAERGVQEEIVVVPLPEPTKPKRGKNLSRTSQSFVRSIPSRVNSKRDHKPRYLLIHGRHRYFAALKSEQKTIRIKVADLDPQNRRAHLEYALVSNEVQSDVDAVTRGLRYQQLIDEGATVEEIATLIKKGVGYVYQHLDMLKLIAPLRRAVQWGHITFTQARELLRLDPDAQKEAWKELATLAANRGKEVKELAMNEVRVVCRAFKALEAADKITANGNRDEERDDKTREHANSKLHLELNVSDMYQNFLRASELGERRERADAEQQPRDPIQALEEIAERLVVLANQSDESDGESEMRQLARRLYTLIAQIEPQLRQSNARAAIACVKTGERIKARRATPKRAVA